MSSYIYRPDFLNLYYDIFVILMADDDVRNIETWSENWKE